MPLMRKTLSWTAFLVLIPSFPPCVRFRKSVSFGAILYNYIKGTAACLLTGERTSGCDAFQSLKAKRSFLRSHLLASVTEAEGSISELESGV